MIDLRTIQLNSDVDLLKSNIRSFQNRREIILRSIDEAIMAKNTHIESIKVYQQQLAYLKGASVKIVSLNAWRDLKDMVEFTQDHVNKVNDELKDTEASLRQLNESLRNAERDLRNAEAALELEQKRQEDVVLPFKRG